ncbi:glycosyltransferase family 39 protein [Curtobacterium sp. NPDC087082]|uniref:glycosyltransferase family 39 protein n=1 Tax=Curtobacterium sp. NPDC087082 TaxID=3363966 RepID=UPI0037F12AEB
MKYNMMWRAPVSIGVLVFLVTCVGIWVPSAWSDEAATLTSTGRTWRELWAELGTIDAVHGLYYAVVKLITAVAGHSILTIRLVSAAAVAVTAALLVVLGRTLGGARLGFASGLAFALVPRVVWAAGEGRMYGFVMLVAVGSTLLLLTAARRTGGPARRAWAVYGLVAALGVLLNLWLVLLVVAHGAALLLVARSSARGTTPGVVRVAPRALVAWAVAAGAVGLATVPYAVVLMSQAQQVAWIESVSARTVRFFVVDGWFRSAIDFTPAGIVTLAVVPVAWTLIGIAVAATIRHRIRIRSPRPAPARPDRTGAAPVEPVLLVLPLAFLPSLLLITATAAGIRTYAPQYASMSAPFVAVLLAAGVLALGRRWLRVLAGALLVATAVPNLVALRLPATKADGYWAPTAATVAEQRHPGDTEGVWFGSLDDAHWANSHLVSIAYPRAFDGMRDLGTVTDAARDGHLWESNGVPARLLPERTADLDRVWFLGNERGDAEGRQVAATLEDLGFERADRTVVGAGVVDRWERITGQ